jgi:hypothetical protein
LFLSLRGHCLKEAGRISEAVASYAEAVWLAPGSRPYRLLLAAAQQERAYPGGSAGVPPAGGAGVPPATYAQAQPPPVPTQFAPGSSPATAMQAVPPGAAGAFPRSPTTSLVTPNQPADPNPLLKIRQQ